MFYRFVAASFALLLLISTRAVAAPVFTTLADPIFAERAPGLDGLLGTADDESLPGVNTSGTASYVEFNGVSPTAGSDFFSFATSTVTINEPWVVVNGQATIDDFSITLSNEQTNGFTSAGSDLDNVPHEFVYEFPGELTAMYTIENCLTTSPTLCLEADLVLSGYSLLPEIDPQSLPGISPELADYINLLTTVAPEGWTAITLTRSPPTEITGDNARGSLASFFIGGTAAGVTVLVSTDPIETVPEPAITSLLALAMLGVLGVARPA